ncbi:Uncharacterised protein [uncultured archaeon]|nr:Uncharacterised protein [uncultured archaeon]
MYRLTQQIQAGLQSMNLQPNLLIEYLQSFFGNANLQFWITAISGSIYQIIVVHENILFYFSFDGRKVDVHTLGLRQIRRIDESYNGSQYIINIFDSNNSNVPFYSANTIHNELRNDYRRLANFLLVGMR